MFWKFPKNEEKRRRLIDEPLRHQNQTAPLHLGRTDLRFTRFIMAACCSVAISLLTMTLYLLGMMDAIAAFSTILLILGSVLLFAVVFRLGWNHRATDPSLTVEMTVTSVLSLLYAMFISGIARDVYVSFFGVVLLFAVFRFPTRTVFYFAAMIFLGYGIVVGIAPPDASPIPTHSQAIARWLSLGTALPLFAIIGGQIMESRRAATRRLATSEERFRRLTELSSDWYWEQNKQFQFIATSPQVQSKIGIASAQLLGKTLLEVVEHANLGSIAVYSEIIQTHQPFSDLEFSLMDDSQTLRWLSINGEPLFDANRVFQGYYGTGHDITERKHTALAVQFQADHDALTGLPNRALFNKCLRTALTNASAKGDELWVLFVDLDRFKLINDSLGHGVGDHVLQTIAKRLQTCLREGDLVARLGGDEFVLLLPVHLLRCSEMMLLDRIMEVVCAPIISESNELTVACSIGIACYPGDGATAEVLLAHADVAMYRVKEAGLKTYEFYKAEMNEKARYRLQLENALRAAI